MKIKDIPRFYERLHALEKPILVGDDVMFSVEHVDNDNKELRSLQDSLWGDDYQNLTPHDRYPDNMVNLELMNAHVSNSDVPSPKLARKLGVAHSVFLKKLSGVEPFKVIEVSALERAIGVEKGVFVNAV